MTASRMPGETLEFAAERRVLQWLDDYVACLDDDRLEDWPNFFAEDGCYRVLSRENLVRGLPAPLVYYYSRGMMLDRVTAIRDALTFEYVYTRHVVSGVRAWRAPDGGLHARSSFAVYQSTEEGVTRLFCVGEYRDRILLDGDGPRFASRDVTLDTFGVLNLIAVPI